MLQEKAEIQENLSLGQCEDPEVGMFWGALTAAHQTRYECS